MRKKGTRARRKRRDNAEYTGGFSAKAFREHLRGYNQQTKSQVESALGAMRLRAHWSRYQEIIHSLLISAPAHVRQLFALGHRRYGELIWGEPFPEIPLSDELIWTAHWLNVRSRQLSGFRKTSLRIQQLVGSDQADTALDQLNLLANTSGHTLWQTELQAAVLQLFKGSAAQRAYTSKLRTEAPLSSVSGFLAYLISDRNDESQTYDSFYSRTLERLPRVAVEGWLQSYLLYRVLQHYDPVPNNIALNLRNERLSSIIDLYETFVESILTIVTTYSLKAFRPAVLRALDILSDLEDSRLDRIRVLAGGQQSEVVPPANDPSLRIPPVQEDIQSSFTSWSTVQDLFVWKSPTAKPNLGKIEAEAYEPLAEVWQNGSRAEKAVGRALKLGVSLKSLDIGSAIAGHAEKQSGKTERTLLLAPGALIYRLRPQWEEIVGGPFDLSIPQLRAYVSREGATDSVAVAILRCVEEPTQTLEGIPPLAQLWLINVYDFQGNYASATYVINNLERLGGRWAREAMRSRFVLAYSRGHLDQACNLLSIAVISQNDVSVELPVSEMFFSRKWKDFSKLDPIEVGIASFCAFDAPPSSSVRHICSSSCRSVMKAGYRSMIESPPDPSMPDTRRKEIVFFFSNVWTEDALGRTGIFESTQEVRVERIKVMQHLIAWDDKQNTDTYVSEIKRLTVNETLWLGLKHLNETRVFVNEPAITRWAEKELTEDYERWLALAGTDSDGEVHTEEKLLQYLAAPADTHSSVQDFKSLTEAEGALILAINRLLTRFLNDPADGLNCYLSLRVRHGTMTGTLFGPSETADLFMPDDEPKDEAIMRLTKAYGGRDSTIEVVYSALSKFTSAMIDVGANLVTERVQIQSDAKPDGLLYAKINFLALPSTFMNVARISFDYFIFVNYTLFWSALGHSLVKARDFFNESVRHQLEAIFSTLVDDLQPVATELPSLLTAVQQTATLTSAQCGIVANWFQVPKHRGVAQQVFTVRLAVDIASKATSNVYPGFSPDLRVQISDEELPLSGLGLSTVADCLFVILQNVAQRSGNPKSGIVTIRVSLLGDDTLVIYAENSISDGVLEQLQAGTLAALVERYGDTQHTAQRIDQEGGSGLPKLWRMTRAVDNPLASEPLAFGLTSEDEWYVQVMLKLVSQDGVYHAA